MLDAKKWSELAKVAAVNPAKLHIGCGRNIQEGWVNLDLTGPADIRADVRNGIPLPDSTVKFIYSEHFLEHLTVQECLRCLRDFYRLLQPGGVIRIATPDLDYVIDKYLGNWRDQDWLKWPEYRHIATKAEMLNISFYSWGHRFLYNEEELARRLRNVGFDASRRCSHRVSRYPELCNLETRADSILIMEAIK